MKIEVLRAFTLAGEIKEVGDVLDAPDALAAELIGMRKAVGVVGEKTATARRVIRKSTPESDTAQ